MAASRRPLPSRFVVPAPGLSMEASLPDGIRGPPLRALACLLCALLAVEGFRVVHDRQRAAS